MLEKAWYIYGRIDTITSIVMLLAPSLLLGTLLLGIVNIPLAVIFHLIIET
jgi:hypothetical protein